MWGIIPVAHCPDSRLRSSWMARGTDTVAMPRATNPASQLHMCGYRVGEATVNAPRSLARTTYPARPDISPISTALGWDTVIRWSAPLAVAGHPHPTGHRTAGSSPKRHGPGVAGNAERGA